MPSQPATSLTIINFSHNTREENWREHDGRNSSDRIPKIILKALNPEEDDFKDLNMDGKTLVMSIPGQVGIALGRDDSIW